MIIAVTGTPGVGKTTVSKLLSRRLGYGYVGVKEFAVENGIGRPIGEELEIDVDELAGKMEKAFSGKNVVIDGHLSHFVPADLVIVLRAHPKLVADRLKKRGYSRKKLSENVEAEFIDVILVEALEENERVIEVDATGKTPGEIVEEIIGLLARGTQKRVGVVDWSDAYDEVIPYLDLGGD
ncbi:adenylate kinase family protein [Thermococcus sp.]|uniref:adenylate kinase family protein n=1 Tax=Thermococcus sp. TaxID=35749 RepID=UPI00261C9CE5|nr:adenylate kinase family protein [Thermococcus sp.]